MNLEVVKSKTTITAVVGLLIAAVQMYMGDATAAQGVQTGLTALVAIFLRSAIGGVSVKADAAASAASDAVAAVQASRDTAQGLRTDAAAQQASTPAGGEL